VSLILEDAVRLPGQHGVVLETHSSGNRQRNGGATDSSAAGARARLHDIVQDSRSHLDMQVP